MLSAWVMMKHVSGKPSLNICELGSLPLRQGEWPLQRLTGCKDSPACACWDVTNIATDTNLCPHVGLTLLCCAAAALLLLLLLLLLLVQLLLFSDFCQVRSPSFRSFCKMFCFWFVFCLLLFFCLFVGVFFGGSPPLQIFPMCFSLLMADIQF